MVGKRITVALALSAVLGGTGALLWLHRWPVYPEPSRSVVSDTQPGPTVPDAHPRQLRPERESATELPQANANAATSEPSGTPLDLTLSLDSLFQPDFRDEAKLLVHVPAQLALTPHSPEPTHPRIDSDLALFDTEHGIRAFTRGHWISDSVRLRGGIGYSTNKRRPWPDLAIGLGIDLAF